MTELRDLYQEVILDHNKNPRNCREMPEASGSAEGYNPLCGDKVRVFVRVRDGVIEDVSFKGAGCAISTASASMLTQALKGKTVEEAKRIFTRFHKLVTGEKSPEPEDDELLGKLAVFSGVCEFPVRVKCATLSWHTLIAALEGEHDTVSSE